MLRLTGDSVLCRETGQEIFVNRDALNECSSQIIAAGIRVHSRLGPGLLESAYRGTLAYELKKAGCRVDEELGLPLVYDDVRFDIAYRIDLLVNDLVIVEVKATTKLNPVHEAALLTYLRLSNHELGLMMNFHEVHLRDGIKRVINGY